MLCYTILCYDMLYYTMIYYIMILENMILPQIKANRLIKADLWGWVSSRGPQVRLHRAGLSTMKKTQTQRPFLLDNRQRRINTLCPQQLFLCFWSLGLGLLDSLYVCMHIYIYIYISLSLYLPLSIYTYIYIYIYIYNIHTSIKDAQGAVGDARLLQDQDIMPEGVELRRPKYSNYYDYYYMTFISFLLLLLLIC